MGVFPSFLSWGAWLSAQGAQAHIGYAQGPWVGARVLSKQPGWYTCIQFYIRCPFWTRILQRYIILSIHRGQESVRCLVLSDIHANRVAFDAVLEVAPDFDEIWCLGDLVGYGPEPNECVERLREFPHVCVLGNHDQGSLGRLDLRVFNLDARVANSWTQHQLTQASREYLETLPMAIEREDFYIVHGSPREPLWEYILESYTAYANFDHFSTPVCLVGHSHIPLLFRLDDEGQHCELMVCKSRQVVQLAPNRMILNPGSVGQPRDGDARASYAMLDTEAMTWEWRRVRYAVDTVQERMRALDFPVHLIERLAVGR